jgi:hypothetical protein
LKYKPRAIILNFFFLLYFCSGSVQGQLNTLETEHLRLIYFDKAHSYLISYVARCFENSFKVYRQLYEYTPEEKITLILHDFSDYSNAGTGTVPKNHITMSIAPISYIFETSPSNERFNATMNHELAHIVTIDKATKRDRFFRTFFGGKVMETYENPLSMFYSQLTTPRRNSPRWYREGIAVFMETWLSGGLGRAQGSYDEMVFRTMVYDSTKILDLLTLESAGTQIDFQVGVNSYLYGTRFMSYLALKYSPEHLIKWTSRSSNTKAFFLSQFKKTYNLSIHEAWDQWIDWEHQFQKTNLELIRQYPTTSYRSIFAKTLGSVSHAYYDFMTEKLYAGVNYPGQLAHIATIDINKGEIEKICDIKGPAMFFVTSLAFDPSTQTLFYTSDNEGLRDLKAVDIKTKQSKTLINDVRVGDLFFNSTDRSIWGVRHFNGISTLVRIPFPYAEWNQIYSLPFGKDLYDIAISPDGTILVGTLAEINGRQTLLKLDIKNLLNGVISDETLYDFELSLPSNFIFSLDGKYLYGSSYYTGVSNIFRYDFKSAEMETISNCETGFFRPLPISNDSLIVFRYTNKGFTPVIISNKPVEDLNVIKFLGNEVVEKHPIVKSWLAGSPAHINLDSLITYSGRYHGFKNIKLASFYPIIEGYKDYPAYGMRINLAGPIGLNNLNVTTSYTPNENLSAEEKWHANLNFSHLNWKINYQYNYADFYDLFGPTKMSRKGYSVGIQYTKTLIYDEPRILEYSVDLIGYGGLERLPDFQNVFAPFDKLLSSSIRLNYQNLQSSLGAVDYEKGLMWEIISTNDYVNSKLYPRIYSNFDYGFLLPINHSSLWFRGSSGYSLGDRFDPFANFFFGGFGNNWVDYLSEKRYREYYSFPGTELNAIPGTNYGKVLFEWNLPPIRFRHLGVPSFYSSWARIALFTTGITTNLDSKRDRYVLYNIGTQIDFQLVLFSRLKAVFSLGYAIAAEKDQNQSNEFMISLKLL